MQGLPAKCRPSIIYLVILSLALIGSLIVTLTLPVSILIKFFLFLFVAGYGAVLIWRQGLLRGKTAITSIQKLSDDKWLIGMGSGEIEAVLRGDSTVTHCVSILRFKAEEFYFPISCTLFPDSFSKDIYRQLVVQVRHG